MLKQIYLFILLLVLSSLHSPAQNTGELRQAIQTILAGRNAVVGVSISGNNGKDTLSVNGDAHLPMQSVFKFHIAMAMLAEVDKGKFSLEQKIKIEKKDIIPNLYSPIAKKYPNGVTMSLAKILGYTVSESDNVGCDLLLKMIGGPKVVEDFFVRNNFSNISIKINEQTMQGNWDMQYQNWTTANAANELLSAFYHNSKKLLSAKSHAFLLKLMKETGTGPARIKGRLPKGTVVAHKTGTSGTRNGLTAAVNDMGIVFLPGGGYFFISVFVSASKESEAGNEKIIADIARVAWDHFAK